MRFISILMAIIGAIMLSLAPAIAADRRTVPANKTSAVGFIYYSTGRGYDCHGSGRGTYRVKKAASHGTVRLEWRKVKGDFQGGCKGKTMAGLAVWYTPRKGYRGDDTFTVQLNVPGLHPGNGLASGRSWTFDIDVK